MVTPFQDKVMEVWEQIALDCGSVDGEGAVDHVEQVFFALCDADLDAKTLARVRRFDASLKEEALVVLRTYG